MTKNKNKLLAVFLVFASSSACGFDPIELGDERAIQSSSPLRNKQSADAVIGQDFYDTNTMPMISDLGFGSLGDIVSNGTTLYIADPANSRILEFKNANTITSGSPATGIIGQPDFFHSSNVTNPIVAGKMAVSEEGSLYVFNLADNKVHVLSASTAANNNRYLLRGTPNPVTGMAVLPNNLIAIAGNNTVEFYSRSPELASAFVQATIDSPCTDSTITSLEFFEASSIGPNLLVGCTSSIWVIRLDEVTYFPVPLPYENCTGSVASIGDGTCNSNNNNPDCGWDNGDCCETTNPSCNQPGTEFPCDCQQITACNGVVCDQPRNPWCDGSVAISYNPSGTCNMGTCHFTEATRVNCDELGQVCNNGTCINSDSPCAGLGQCASPPPNTCDGNLATQYPTNGTCSIGGDSVASCEYSPISVTCSDSQVCNFGVCVSNRIQQSADDLRNQLYSDFLGVGDLTSTSRGLFVLDRSGNRVLFFDELENQIRTHAVVQIPADASRVFGQPGSNSTVANYHNLNQGSPSDQGLDTPKGITVLRDDAQLWVADSGNFRVNRYAYSEPDNTADRVLGQSDYSHNQANRLILRGFLNIGTVDIGYSENGPYTLVVDPSSHRVVRFDNISTYVIGSNPNEKVFGQSSVTDYQANRGDTDPGIDTLNTPVDVSVDPISGKIAIADYGNQRIVIYENKNALGANQALGVTNLTSTGTAYLGFKAVAMRNNQLFVAVSTYLDNSLNDGVPTAQANRIFHYDIEQNESSFVKPQRVFGQSYAETSDYADRALPANECNRGAASASHDTLCDITDLFLDQDGTLWVADSGNHRILWFENPTAPREVEATAADGVVGQRNFQENAPWQEDTPEDGAYRFRKPASIGLNSTGGLWVADNLSSRVLFFPTPKTREPLLNLARATIGIGNELEAYNSPQVPPTSSTLTNPQSLAVSTNGDFLLVADNGNKRVLRYTHNRAPIINGGGTFTLEVGQTKEVTLEITDPENDPLDPIKILEEPIPNGVSLNGNTVTFSALNQTPNTTTTIHLSVSDQSPRKNTTTATITFRVTGRSRNYEREPTPPSPAQTLTNNGNCTALALPFEALVFIVLYGMRRFVLLRRHNEE